LALAPDPEPEPALVELLVEAPPEDDPER